MVGRPARPEHTATNRHALSVRLQALGVSAALLLDALGVLMTFAPEIETALGVTGPVLAERAIFYRSAARSL